MYFNKAFDRILHGRLGTWDLGCSSQMDSILAWCRTPMECGSGGFFFRLKDCEQQCAAGISAESIVIPYCY